MQSDFIKDAIDIASALYYTFFSGLYSIIRALLNCGANVNEKRECYSIALHAASIYEHKAVMQ